MVIADVGGVVITEPPFIVDRAFLMLVLDITAESERGVLEDVERRVEGMDTGGVVRGVVSAAERGVAVDTISGVERGVEGWVEGGVEGGAHFTPAVKTLFFNLLENMSH